MISVNDRLTLVNNVSKKTPYLFHSCFRSERTDLRSDTCMWSSFPDRWRHWRTGCSYTLGHTQARRRLSFWKGAELNTEAQHHEISCKDNETKVHWVAGQWMQIYCHLEFVINCTTILNNVADILEGLWFKWFCWTRNTVVIMKVKRLVPFIIAILLADSRMDWGQGRQD